MWQPDAEFWTHSRARLVRFGVSGAFTTIAYFVASIGLHYGFGISPSTSSALSYLMAVVLSYLLQSRFTFRTKNDSSQQVARFAIVTLMGLAVSWGLVKGLTGFLHQPAWIATIGVCIVIPILNYVLFHVWVFVPPDAKAPNR